MRCMAHIINLVVQDGLKGKDEHEVISRIREAVRYVRNSPTRYKKFQECVEFMETKKLLSLDVPTRWNSTYLMLEAAACLKSAFDAYEDIDLAYKTGLSNNSFDGVPIESDWDRAKLLLKFLKHFTISHCAFSVLRGKDDVKSELEKYLSEDVEEYREKFDILKWWKVNTQRFPILSKMARDTLAVPISTVASEAAFSTGGRVLDAFRSSLSPKIVQAIICAQDWIRKDSKPISIEEDLSEIETLEQELTKLGVDSTIIDI
ncbi:UNVERIFIED_CONTAM: putative AC transposase [Sesamum latifolium]|uniref:AC transposase n=1 Tax=Sesamum latifolium TaxID=2727402 RepID=A0AAW2SMA2_9LAMI